MAKKHYTALGEQIDMAALAMKNAMSVAIGNAGLNARGDRVGQGGIVLRTQEQIEEEWRRAKEAREASVGQHDIKQPLPGVGVPGKKLDEDQDFDPPAAVAASGDQSAADRQQPRRRKMVDSD